MRAARAGIALVAALALVASGCRGGDDDLRRVPPVGCLPDGVTNLQLTADPQLVRIPNEGAAAVSVAVAPRGETAAEIPAGPEERYWFDLGGDGEFEGMFAGRAATFEVTAAVRYPLQVTGALCAGGIVAGRTQIQGFRSLPPIVTLSWTPREPFWLQVGAQLTFDVYALDPDGAGPLDVWWHWGDGEAGLQENWDFGGGNLLAQHQFLTRGIREFELRVTDVAGDTTVISRPLLISSLAEPLLELAPGKRLSAAQVMARDATDPAAGALIVAGLDAAGVAVYAPVTDAPRVSTLDRTTLWESYNARPVDMAALPSRRMVVVAADDFGIFTLDVTDPTNIRSVRPAGAGPGPLIPALPAGSDMRVAVQRVWSCSDETWLLAHNALDGIYLWTLTGEPELAAARALEVHEAGVIANPWTGRLRLVAGQPAGAAIPAGRVRGLACAAERYVGVLDDLELTIWDLAPLLADGSAPVPLAVPLPTVAPGLDASGSGLAAVELAAEPGRIRWTATLGPHGLAEWTSDHGPAGISDITLTRRYWHVLKRLRGDDVWDSFTDLWRRDDTILVGDDSYGLWNAVVRLDFGQWSTADAQARWYPWRNDKCAPGSITNGTDDLKFVTHCVAIDAPRRFVGEAHDQVWGTVPEGWLTRFHRFDVTDITARSGWLLPESWQATALVTDAIWVFPGARAAVYAATEPNLGVTAGPVNEIALPIGPNDVVAGPPGTTAMLLVNDLDMAWASAGSAGPVIEAVATVNGLSAAALRPTGLGTGWVGLMRADSTRVDIWRLHGGALYDIHATSMRPGYRDIVACPDEFYAGRPDGDAWAIDRFKPIVGTLAHSVQSFAWGQLEGPQPTAWVCDAVALWTVVDLPDESRVRVDAWPLGVSTGTALATLYVPYQPNDPPSSLRLGRAGSLLGVHIGGRLSGIHVFDMANLAAPDYVAADLGPSIAGLQRIQMLAEPGGGMRYGGVWEGPKGTTLIVRRVR